MVAVITAKERRLAQIAEAVSAHFPAGEAAKVQFFSLADFCEFLHNLPDPPPAAPSAAAPTERTIRGRKVKLKFAALTPEEHAAKTDAAFKLLASEM